MQSRYGWPPLDFHRAQVIFVAPESKLKRLNRLIAKFAPLDWKGSKDIRVVGVADSQCRNIPYVRSLVKRSIQHGRVARLICLKDELPTQAACYTKLPRAVEREHFWLYELEDARLELLLRHYGLHWTNQIAEALATRWQSGDINQSRILAWLDQFEQVKRDSHRWVGEGLLRVFEIWSTNELAQRLRPEVTRDSPSNHVCIVRYENGKSADAISYLFRKIYPDIVSCSGGLHELRELIDSETRPASVIILEDGLFSGFEFVRILQSLVGDAGCAKPKCPRLKNPEIFNSTNICLHFALATDLGIHHLRKALKLTNVRISYPESGYYQVLSTAGRDALGRGVLFETDPDGIHVVASPEHYLNFSAFRNEYVWGDQDKKRRAIEFCRKVGTELWRDRVGGKDPPWSERRINDCSLGASNMALAFAFSHSIPKASLPLFWYSGPVSTEGGKTIIWEALFPNSSS